MPNRRAITLLSGLLTALLAVGAQPAVAATPAGSEPSVSGSPATGSGDYTYIADGTTGEVLKVAADGSQAVVASGLNGPNGVAVDATGDVYIAQQYGDIVEISESGERSDIPVTGAYDVAVAADGTVYGVVPYAGTVVKVSPDGTQTDVVDGLAGPQGLALDAAGTLYIAESNGGRVLKLAPGDGQEPVVIASGLGYPVSVAVSATGDVYASEWFNNRVVTIAADGSVTPVVTAQNGIYGVAVGSDGDIYSSEPFGGSVTRTGADGTATSVGSGLAYPRGIAVGPSAAVTISGAPSDATAGTAYSFSMSVTGVPLPLVTLADGDELPDGVELSPGGELSGTPSTGGTSTFTLLADNGVDPAATIEVSLTVNQVPAFTADDPATTATVDSPYSASFTATGFPAPAYSLASGTVPIGVNLDPRTGQLVGTPTSAGTFTFQVQASNGIGSAALSAEHQLVVAPAVGRVAGSDRFTTSVEVSKAAFPHHADTVFIASGMSFPDALSAGPAAASLDAPVLLTTPTALPGDVVAEIQRLGATSAVIVGGVNVVSSGVQTQLEKLVTDVHRVAGADRFETSRAIAAFAFPTHADAAVIATGANFPDALAAGAAIGSTGPVILVNGSAASLDAATTKALTSLDPEKIWIAGGENAVTSGIQTALGKISTTGRLAGTDRYETAQRINDQFFSSADRMLIATGAGFPDALAGAAWAAQAAAPLYVVPGGCVPNAVIARITALGVDRVSLLGGPGALSPAVESLTPCS